MDKSIDINKSKLCDQCGNTFYRDKRGTYAHWGKARFCSRKCSAHYYSDIRKAAVPDIETAFWLKVEKGGQNECWQWIGTKDRDGYPVVSFRGKMLRATRVAVTISGRKMNPKHHACHSCGNAWCCNPSHIYSGTPKQNSDDKLIHGTRVMGENLHSAKLTEIQVREIRLTNGTNSFVANLFGVTPSNISSIKNRKTWRHVL